MANERQSYVYILASGKNGTLYIGVASDLVGRVYTHSNDLVAGFTRQYGVHDLVYFEHHEAAESAIIREKQMKKWNHAWKIELLEQANLQWLDLYHSIAEV